VIFGYAISLKAVVIRKHGGPDVLSYEEIDGPQTTKGHAIVKVDYCAVNHLDIWVRNGLPGKQVLFPHILGCDISGTLVEGFGKFKKGEKVVVYSHTKRCTKGVIFHHRSFWQVSWWLCRTGPGSTKKHCKKAKLVY